MDTWDGTNLTSGKMMLHKVGAMAEKTRLMDPAKKLFSG